MHLIRQLFHIASSFCALAFCVFIFYDYVGTRRSTEQSPNSYFDIQLLRPGHSIRKENALRYVAHEQKKGAENLNDLDGIISENSDLLPNRTNNLRAKHLCAKKNTCIPKFKQIETRIRITPKYKMINCLVQKSMSTLMSAIFCFLYDEQAFLLRSNGFYTEWSKFRLCQSKNSFNDLKKTREEFSISKKDQTWSITMLTRDPVERFISGYVDKCIRKAWVQNPCNGCKKNLTCFIEKEYERMLTVSKLNKFRATFEDRHFFPQNWRCNLRTDYKHYKFIKYSSSDTDQFLKQFISITKKQQVPESSINYMKKQLTMNRTVHSTVSSSARTYLENRLRNSPYLMEYVVKMFYHDFLLFNYSFPTGFS